MNDAIFGAWCSYYLRLVDLIEASGTESARFCLASAAKGRAFVLGNYGGRRNESYLHARETHSNTELC